ncbi:hypothetical protein ACB098_06G067900 [Castanea mollissima]|uniref:VQ domain-containing protein n=2 Tax=Fagaceae TaxID=3503 RepID=A0A8J4RWQ0_9ROSI|nr:hypothetical protein CMV_005656 [Castanea mollissima]
MENTSKPQDRENPSPTNSPTSNVSNGFQNQNPTPPLTPKPIPRSDSNPYPTTFVQADTSNFKQVVQMLTGSSDTTSTKQSSKDPPPQSSSSSSTSSSKNHHHHHSIPPIRTPQKKQQGFKLYERRNNLKNSLMINTLIPNFAHQTAGFSPRNKPEILSPSLLDFPSLALSPVTPLNGEDPFDKSSSPSLGSSSEEEKAIAEKKFYLHPSPITTPRDAEPQLLPLFPLTSPRVSGSSS